MRYLLKTGLLPAALLGAMPLIYTTNVFAAESSVYTEEQMRQCLAHNVLTADKSMTIRKLEEACAILLSQSSKSAVTQSSYGENKNEQSIVEHSESPKTNETNKQPDGKTSESTVSESTIAKSDQPPGVDPNTSPRMFNDRSLLEELNRSNRFVLTPHKRNYILPASYTNNPNTAPYEESIANNESETDKAFSDLKHTEFEFQISVKILLLDNIINDKGNLFLGYTNHSLWQVYNRETSSPFRETNHQPEIILSFSNDFEIFGFRNVLNEVSLNHESNGQSGVLSRSWNRIMFNSIFEGENFSFAINPWYRIPEDKSRYPGDPHGDDNPDITHYMGNFQFTGAYKLKSNIFSIEVRNNLKSDNRGAVELGWTFPLTPTMRGYVSYFDGYGHSLIDYNDKQQVIGLGVTFADLF